MECTVCSSRRVIPFFEVKNSPSLQNVLFDTLESAKASQTLAAPFFACENCCHLFNPEFKEIPYSPKYNNDQSFSDAYAKHLEAVFLILKRRLDPKSKVLEIGCGNGELLKKMYDDGYSDLEGYDPAHAKNYPFVKKAYWLAKDKKYDVIILRHTLEGIVSFKELLISIVASLETKGFLYLELTDARYIVESGSTFTLYHEYPQYFSETSVSILLNQLGLYIEGITDFFSGDIIGVTAKKSILGSPKVPNIEILKGLGNIYIWGVSGRTIHFLTNYNLDASIVIYGVDIDPKKQKMFIPFTGQLIISPEECILNRPEAVIVLNENYKDEILKMFPYPIKIITCRDFYGEQ